MAKKPSSEETPAAVTACSAGKDVKRSETELPTVQQSYCRVCSAPLAQGRIGRPRKYCSEECRLKAYAGSGNVGRHDFNDVDLLADYDDSWEQQ